MPQFVPKKEEKEVISMRLPGTTLEQIDAAAAAADMSRNEFLNQCIRFALDHMQ